jgi:hypothetical protein
MFVIRVEFYPLADGKQTAVRDSGESIGCLKDLQGCVLSVSCVGRDGFIFDIACSIVGVSGYPDALVT